MTKILYITREKKTGTWWIGDNENPVLPLPKEIRQLIENAEEVKLIWQEK